MYALPRFTQKSDSYKSLHYYYDYYYKKNKDLTTPPPPSKYVLPLLSNLLGNKHLLRGVQQQSIGVLIALGDPPLPFSPPASEHHAPLAGGQEDGVVELLLLGRHEPLRVLLDPSSFKGNISLARGIKSNQIKSNQIKSNQIKSKNTQTCRKAEIGAV